MSENGDASLCVNGPDEQVIEGEVLEPYFLNVLKNEEEFWSAAVFGGHWSESLSRNPRSCDGRVSAQRVEAYHPPVQKQMRSFGSSLQLRPGHLRRGQPRSR